MLPPPCVTGNDGSRMNAQQPEMNVQVQRSGQVEQPKVYQGSGVVACRRLTPKQLHVTLPSGLVLKFKRFDRVGRPLTMWRSWYGGNTTPRKYIDIRPA